MKWKWWVDLTKGQRESDDERLPEFISSLAPKYNWMREEERVGRILGLILAFIVWGWLLLVFIHYHPFGWHQFSPGMWTNESTGEVYKGDLPP